MAIPLPSCLRGSVRLRPAMYVGSLPTGEAAVHCAKSLMTDALGIRGASRVRLCIGPEGLLRLWDDGAPISREAFAPLGDEGGSLIVSAEKWLSVLAALSSTFAAQTQEGWLAFSAGRPEGAQPTEPDAEAPRIRMQLDPEVLGPMRPDAYTLYSWARDYAATSPGITLQIEPADTEGRTFFYPRGLTDLVAELDYERTRASAEILSFSGSDGPCAAAVALRFCHTGERRLVSFVNHERTGEHGDHVDGFLEALRTIVGDRSQAPLTACIAVTEPEPRWHGSPRQRLLSPTARQLVRQLVEAHGAEISQRYEERCVG